ncbi:MAG: hypothetical protein EBU08_11270, partial [Micrococcales bacterium]|nr:hypothetical protein [Micrococcales bacterium]
MARKPIISKKTTKKITSLGVDRILALISGIAISVMSAFYSIVGLAAIFSGATTAIYLMGTTLEIGKVVTASYLHRNWSNIPVLMRAYFVSAVVVLMAITSMGTFGYLSKAHIEHTSGTEVSQIKIERINRQIASEQKDIDRAEANLAQLDAAVDSMISRDFANSGLRARAAQQEERAALEKAIKEAETKIDALTDERIPYDAQIKSLELEVGPIRYVAELIYGESNTQLLEKSVRWMIIFLVLVFDPLAIMLILVGTSKDKPKPSAA